MTIVQGKVISAEDGKPLEFATVAITDSAGKPIPVNGNFISRQTAADGSFNIPITLPDSFIRIGFVGFAPLVLKGTEAATKKEFVLGASTSLSEVVITAKKTANTFWNKYKWYIIGGAAVLALAVIYFATKPKK